MVEDTYGAHSAKLPAGDLILYPATSLHRVNPVTRGIRLASFFWIQSMVRDDGERTLLFDLDMAINRVNKAIPNHPGVIALTSCYHKCPARSRSRSWTWTWRASSSRGAARSSAIRA